jgi:DNA-binding XRE family transcriptional regulator
MGVGKKRHILITKNKSKMKEKKTKPKSKLYGNKIRQILQEIEMSPQELADRVETSPSHISRIINGQRRCISLPIAIKIALVLGRPVEDIFIYKNPEIQAV